MKKNLILICGFLLCAAFVMAQTPAQKLTLKECVEVAIKNNLTVHNSNVLSQAADINLQQAKGNELPNINGNIYQH